MRNVHSPLADFIHNGIHGNAHNGAGIIIKEIEDRYIIQLGFWLESHALLSERIQNSFDIPQIPQLQRASSHQKNHWMLVEPFKYWLDISQSNKVAHALRGLNFNDFTALDISDGKSVVDISGRNIAQLLQRIVPINCADTAFPIGDFRATMMHHAMVHILRTDHEHYRFYLPRSFAAFLVGCTIEQSMHYGVEVI